jgi:acyl transferase domain-containing protein
MGHLAPAAPDASAGREPIAAGGLGCRVPGEVECLDPSWRLLRAGADAYGPISPWPFDANDFYDGLLAAPGHIEPRLGSFLNGIEEFDGGFSDISPRDSGRLDPQHRLPLETAWGVVADARLARKRHDGSKIGVHVGTWIYEHEDATCAAMDNLDLCMIPGSGRDAATDRHSSIIDLQGSSRAVDAAFSSSLVAAHLARESLWAGDDPHALAGGVNLIPSPETRVASSTSGMLARDGRCRTFDAADGCARGKGCAMVVLKRLGDALADGDRALAVNRGAAVNRAALADAGPAQWDPRHVEAYGVGSALADPIEAQALGTALGAGRDDATRLPIGLVKTGLGHAEVDAGSASPAGSTTLPATASPAEAADLSEGELAELSAAKLARLWVWNTRCA